MIDKQEKTHIDWKEIFGDSIKSKMIYDVIGELVSLKNIFKKDKSELQLLELTLYVMK